MSVTTILENGIPKLALKHWAAWEAAKCAVDSVPQLVKARGEEARAELTQWIKQASDRKSDKAKNLGSAIHGFLEAQILGQPTPDYTDEQKPFIDGFARFLDDWQPQFEATELTVANPDHRYAGTLDAILRIPLLGDGLGVLDYKTGKAVWSEAGTQLAAYRRCRIGWTRPNGTEVKPPETGWGRVLHIRPKGMEGGSEKGYVLRFMDTSDERFEKFLAAQVTAEDNAPDGPASRVVGPPEKLPSVQEEIPA
jgi:hypothetical protein